MATITLRVLDGADRGKVFGDMPTPITIGREEGNAVQLNDERISRFHVKIQEDQDKLVLTDLESTNGTRVNGEQTHLRILRFGDVISLGRSTLLYGTREQIAGRLDDLRSQGKVTAADLEASSLSRQLSKSSSEFELPWQDSEQLRSTLHLPSVPELPGGLSPSQAAQLSELLEYLHLRSRMLIDSVKIPPDQTVVKLAIEQWQSVLDMQALLAEYMRKIGEPDLEA